MIYRFFIAQIFLLALLCPLSQAFSAERANEKQSANSLYLYPAKGLGFIYAEPHPEHISSRNIKEIKLKLSYFDNSGGQYIDTLDANGTVISQAESMAVTNLRLLGGSTTLDNPANDFDIIAANVSSNFSLTDADDLTIGAVLATNGLSAGGAVNIIISGNDQLLNIAQPITAHADSSLVSDKMNITANINTDTAILTIIQDETVDAGDGIHIGTIGDATANTLELSDAELDFITAGSLSIGNVQTGNMTLTNPVNPAIVTIVSLVSGSDIIQLAGATVSVASMVLKATGINLAKANDVDNIAATASADFNFSDINDFIVSRL